MGPAPEADAWLRLDARMLLVAVTRGVLSVLPILLALALFGADLDRGVRVALLATVVIGLAGTAQEAFQWLTARYRVTAERVELRTGLLTRSSRWVPRERVRTVNVSAKPLHRFFGLAALSIGTGEGRASGERHGLQLDAIRAGEAERLRSALLDRAAPTTPEARDSSTP
ncbi:MAG TPA: PH domain-containing protein, partial [Solirubrobacterales bacterium]|nr:PH domain-containing protein [Solirubrobacterales bacterium]